MTEDSWFISCSRLAFAFVGRENRAINSEQPNNAAVDHDDTTKHASSSGPAGLNIALTPFGGLDEDPVNRCETIPGSGAANNLSPDSRLVHHLQAHLGLWPPPTGLTIVGSAQRTKPGWGEAIRPVLGIETIHGTLLSVPPKFADQVRALGTDLDVVGPQLAQLIGKPSWRFGRGFFRWTTSPMTMASHDEPGIWMDATDPRLPGWLNRFSGEALVAVVDGDVAACVGIKRHNHWGHELAITTEQPYRRSGIAARLVAQAAHRVLDQGAIPLYVHADDNLGSAKTAQRAGFGDSGWRVVGIFPSSR